MEKRQLGRTGIEITAFVYGAGSIGGIGGSPETRGLGLDAEQGFSRLSEAHALGIRVVDTADSYGGGESERTVGRWLAGQQPEDVLVETKVGGTAQGIDLSGPHIERQLAQSIERLGRVDLYLSHAPDPTTPLEETVTAFAAAKGAGLIKAYGVCNVDARLLEALLATASNAGLPRPEWIQNGFNLLDCRDEAELLPLVEAEGLGYMAFSPLAGGVLSDRYLDGAQPAAGSRIAVAGEKYYAGMYSADNLVRVARLRDLAQDKGISVAGMALAWLHAHPVITAPVISPSTATQWQAVHEALENKLDEETFAAVSEIFS
ncbi:aldo/keto reductase [Amycolatopsis saalfeldensis]|uniref:Predicted oxidoreductase n=1 Tax=Amycolatopsis saalfeldensis TaxID=394193 RepID=A0A1H8XH27_9PSEU|nr:aldo/keto reductase [Amycolatopsis saalfeldensis]SEP39290.1 Predicted oxidoreductase [Amycolatopsis saalfeldensis]